MERADITSKMQIAWLGFLVVGGGGVLFIFSGVMITIVTKKQMKQCTKKIEGAVVQYQFPGGEDESDCGICCKGWKSLHSEEKISWDIDKADIWTIRTCSIRRL